VPFRNAHLIAIAASLAEVAGASQIYIGVSEVDYSGYPDCRREFFDAMEEAIAAGTKPETHIRIITPLIRKTKREIVREGLRLQAPFEISWSCYRESEIACGKCASCQLRLKGFEEAGANDPLRYM
jgi:7-cyano-7-deazaguanine synthase